MDSSSGCARRVAEKSWVEGEKRDAIVLRFNMLAKRYKIPSRYRIQRVFEKGRKISGRLFSLRYFPNTIGPRCAVITPVKLKVKPVKRNRIRRRLYEMIRLLLGLRPDSRYATLRMDFVIVAHTSMIANLPFETLTQEFKRLSFSLFSTTPHQ